MITVSSHSIDRAVLAEKTDNTRNFLPQLRDLLPERPDLLAVYARRSIEFAAGIIALELAEDSIAWLRRSARANALMFVSCAHPDQTSAIELGDGTTLSVTLSVALSVDSPGDTSKAHAPAWIDAVWCAIACDDAIAQSWLATIDIETLRRTEIACNEYVFAYAALLKSLLTRDGRHVQWLTKAIEQCEPSPDLETTQDWIDHFDYPVLRAIYPLLADKTADFNSALAELLENHRDYWRRDEEKLGVQGLISLPAIALARLAYARGMTVEVQSGYMPDIVWRTSSPATLSLCPYCVSPKPTIVNRCTLCGRDTSKDAPIEMTMLKLRAEKNKSCTRCGYPLHALANTCPSCRQRQ